jgi:Major Facilitator Superfamily
MADGFIQVGGILAFGISHFEGHAIKSWQLLFLVLGLVTVVWSFCIGMYLPDSPMKAKCFSEEDKKLMIERVRHNETGIQNKKYKKYQIIEALTDPFVWCCVLLILVANLVIGGLGVFSNLIIKQFGFTVLQTQLLNIAQGALTIVVMVSSALLSQKAGQTCLVMIVSPPVNAILILHLLTPFLGMDYPGHHRNSRHHRRESNTLQCRGSTHCLLLHPILPRSG